MVEELRTASNKVGLEINLIKTKGALISVCADDSLHLWNLRQKMPEIAHSLKFQRERITCCHLPFQSKWLYIGTVRGNIHVANVESFVLSGYVINWNKAIELSRKTHPGAVVHLSDNPIDQSKFAGDDWDFEPIVLPDLEICLNIQDSSLLCRKELAERHGIVLSDRGDSSKIDMLVESDLSSKITTGRQVILECGVIALETLFGLAIQSSMCMLVGFESGAVVLWDLKNKIAEYRFQHNETLLSISWHHDGRQFMCSHADGSLSTWNLRTTQKTPSVTYPHGKMNKDGIRTEACKPIDKVEWKMSRTGEAYTIFSGGLSGEMHHKTPSVTIIYGKTTTVLEMEHDVINFITLCESPWESDCQDPYAVVVLLHNDLVVIDLTTPGYPCFENPYPMDLHESPVTYCTYLVNCPPDLIPALYSVGSKSSKRSGFSSKGWPISGGEWGTNTCSYPEIIITGHADGSLKFWDSSAVSLEVLYKLKVAKNFEKPKQKSFDGIDEDPFAIQMVAFCPESRLLCVAIVSSHVLLFRFNKSESVAEVPSLELPIVYELNIELDDSPEYDYISKTTSSMESRRSERGSCSSEEGHHSSFEYFLPLKKKTGPIKRPAGFQAELVCLTPWVDGEPPGLITALNVNSSYGIMAYGNENGLVVVDIVQRICLYNVGTPDLYGSSDPYQRVPRSPKKNPSDNNMSDSERNRSPTASDQCAVNGNLGNRVDAECVTCCHVRHSLRSSPSLSGNISEKLESEHSSSEKLKNYSSLTISPSQSATHSSVSQSDKCSSVDSPSAASDNDLDEFRSQWYVVDTPSVNKNQNASENNCSNPIDKNGNTFNNTATCDINPPVPPPRRRRKKNVKSAPEGQSDEVDGLCISKSEDKNVKKFSVRKTSSNKEDKLGVDSNSVSNIVMQFKRSVSMKDRVKKEWKRSKSRSSDKEILVDLRGDTVVTVDNSRKVKGPISRSDKIDSQFIRSRSSSSSSLENISSEAIQSLIFIDSYCRKSDINTSPTLWVGTSLGSVIVLSIILPPPGEARLSQRPTISPSGTVFRLKGPILSISFLDSNGLVIPEIYDSWKGGLSRDESVKGREEKKPVLTNSSSLGTPPNNTKGRASPTSCTENSDQHFVVIATDKQARVLSLPSQSNVYGYLIGGESSFVVRADVCPFREPGATLANKDTSLTDAAVNAHKGKLVTIRSGREPLSSIVNRL
ncbi:Syntaxin-binding protein 5 [Nymphon striatum]|nr:Syntaxin-binding protein 5 [Nymphon striatum]